MSRKIRNLAIIGMLVFPLVACSAIESTLTEVLPKAAPSPSLSSEERDPVAAASPQSSNEASRDDEESPIGNAETATAVQQQLYDEIKEEQKRYSKRQNRLVCSMILTDPGYVRQLFEGVEGLTFEQYLDPLFASCVEWVGDLTEDQMLAEVFYQKEIAQDAARYCNTYKKVGRKVMTQSLRNYLENAGEPVVLARPIAAVVVRECKRF